MVSFDSRYRPILYFVLYCVCVYTLSVNRTSHAFMPTTCTNNFTKHRGIGIVFKKLCICVHVSIAVFRDSFLVPSLSRACAGYSARSSPCRRHPGTTKENITNCRWRNHSSVKNAACRLRKRQYFAFATYFHHHIVISLATLI